jgi:hypothetical protein
MKKKMPRQVLRSLLFTLLTLYFIACEEEKILQQSDAVNTINGETGTGKAGFLFCPDAVISSMSVSNISGNSFLVTYSLKNIGFLPMDLSHMFIQSYVSTDNIYNPGDPASGGFADYGPSEPLLQPGEVRQKTQFITANVSIVTHPYVIFQLKRSLPGPSPECSTANNTASKIIQTGCPDAIISNMSVSNVSGNSFLVTYDIKNVGTVPMDITHMFIQSYVSADGTYSADDPASGGFADYGPAELPLQPNQVRQKTQFITANVSIVTYPYVIFQLKRSLPGPSPECSTVNNTASKIIQTGCPDAIISNMIVSNVSGNSFLVTYSIKNIGTVPMDITHMFIQSYVSTDDVFNVGDPASGGFADYGPLEPILHPNEVRQKTQFITANVSIVTYPYAIFQLKSSLPGPSSECSTANNSGSKFIQ